MKIKTIKEQIEAAFREGYASYESPCCPHNNVDDAWYASDAKTFCDKIKEPRP